MFSSFFFGYALFYFIGGVASDKFGAKNVFTLAMTVWSSSAARPRPRRHGDRFLVIRVMFGTGEGPFSSTDNKIVNNWFPTTRTSERDWYHQSGQPLGGALAGPVVGLMASVPAGAFRSSRSLLGLAWVLFWLVTTTERPAQVTSADSGFDRAGPLRWSRRAASAADRPAFCLIPSPSILATAFAFFAYA